MSAPNSKIPLKIQPKISKPQRKEIYLILKPSELFFLRNYYKQVEYLNRNLPNFQQNQYPSKHEILKICSELEKSPEKIRNWFKHQRKRDVTQGKWKFTVFYHTFLIFVKFLTKFNLAEEKLVFEKGRRDSQEGVRKKQETRKGNL